MRRAFHQAGAGWFEQFAEREMEIAGASAKRNLRGFVPVFVLGFAAQYLGEAARLWGHFSSTNWAEVTVIPTCILLASFHRTRRLAFGLLGALAVTRIVQTFPSAGNHVYLEAMIFGLLALLDPENPRELRWLMGALKWFFLMICFYSGLQKFLHGHYQHGEFFAYTLARSQSFRQFFAWFLPESELHRLEQYAWTIGSGPYRLHSSMGLLISHVTYLGEMITAMLIAFRRTRTVGLIAGFMLIVAIEAGAHEFFFGLLFLNLMMLFAPWRIATVVRGLGAVGYLLLFLGRTGIILQGMHFG